MVNVIVIILLGLSACSFGRMTVKYRPILKIVGGQYADNSDVPYQVSLKNISNYHLCGGSIITPNTILTAAHCIRGVSPYLLRVVVGTAFLNYGGTTYAVSRIKYHPQFNPRVIKNDIGLVITVKTILLGPMVAIVPLESNYVGANVSALVTGWGKTFGSGNISNILQKLNVKTISTIDCQTALVDVNLVDSSEICTFTQKGEGTCKGDSGGPLVADGKQIGVVSWAKPCALGYPDVYTRVSSFYSWIVANCV